MLADVVEAAGRDVSVSATLLRRIASRRRWYNPGDVLVEHNDGANPSGSALSSSTIPFVSVSAAMASMWRLTSRRLPGTPPEMPRLS
ncbi:hypothetical protein [Mycolicibacterium sp. D5.8-2]|jgi:hypothetical protein|uniref:hypothetical protein n=1 Tax=Mycolicibacterium sp. D5.8-2 TaxID=3085903 RepID=UPI0012DE77B1|nr:hypothetical protein [Mycolicibacterium sp. D5.8-2]MDW5613905.1 hypothetical protein [Mycolicibacterium sp. D5.8-2]